MDNNKAHLCSLAAVNGGTPLEDCGQWAVICHKDELSAVDVLVEFLYTEDERQRFFSPPVHSFAHGSRVREA